MLLCMLRRILLMTSKLRIFALAMIVFTLLAPAIVKLQADEPIRTPKGNVYTPKPLYATPIPNPPPVLPSKAGIHYVVGANFAIVAKLIQHVYEERPDLRCEVLNRQEHLDRDGCCQDAVNKLVIEGYWIQCLPRCTCTCGGPAETEPTPAKTPASKGKGVQ